MSMAEHNWQAQQEKGNFLLLRLCLYLYRCLGRGFFLVILSLIVWWYWLFSAAARRHSLNYLRRVHQQAQPDSPFTSTPNAWHSFLHLRQFAISILDKIDAWLGRHDVQQLKIVGHAHLQPYYQRGAILLVSHFGNIELLRAVKSEHVQQVNVLVYRKHAEQFNRFLSSLNPHAATRLIAVDEIGIDTALHLQQCLDAGEWIIIAADRVPAQSKRYQPIDFLGASAPWPEGPWLLAQLLKAPVLAVFCYCDQQQWQLHIHPIAEQLHFKRAQRRQQLQHYMQHYVGLQQQHCLRAPYQWFNFYDFWQHNSELEPPTDHG